MSQIKWILKIKDFKCTKRAHDFKDLPPPLFSKATLNSIYNFGKVVLKTSRPVIQKQLVGKKSGSL